jgi:UDPglucose--hexose-1-phosphate uridylyltransferase
MSEFRKDPFHNKWVLIVPKRGKRPHAFFNEVATEDKILKKDCPFCEGNETMTPPEVDSFRNSGKADEPGWKVRVFPNKYPALNREIKIDLKEKKYQKKVEGYGFHEVIAETPSHDKDIYSMNQEELVLVLKMYRKRYRVLKKRKNIKSVFIFKNHGRAAGASLSHSHSQILALPIIPPSVEEEMQIIKKTKTCVYCGLLKEAFNEKRVLSENSEFVVFAPYASAYPYQLLALPRKHQPFFEEIEDKQITLLSILLKGIFRKYEKLLGKIPFNCFFNLPSKKEGHWNIQITPKLTIPAGFEKGTGIYINPVPPEIAVTELKRA